MSPVLPFLIVLTATISWTAVEGQTVTGDGCYQMWTGGKVNCMDSYERRAGVTEQQCLDICTQQFGKCQAVQYAVGTQTCDLYSVYIPAGSVGRRKRNILIFHNNYLRMKRGGNYQPTYTAGGGTSYVSGPGCYGPTIQSIAGYNYYKPTGQCQGLSTTMAPTTAAPSACPAGQTLRYYLANGYHLQGNPDFTFTVDSEQACIAACTANQQNGNAATCKSADYNTQTKQCQVYSSQSFPPGGTGVPVEDTSFNHYEKVCLDSSIGENCKGPFFLGPQHILVGFAQTVTTAADRNECLSLCLNAQSRFGFQCLSGMFYYQETTNNCILNSEGRSDHPDLYTPESSDKVDYFEPSCASNRVRRAAFARNRNVLQLKSSDFGSWTMCDSIVRDHQRFKECSSFNPNKCMLNKNTCNPAKEIEYDLQIVDPISGPDDEETTVKPATRQLIGTTKRISNVQSNLKSSQIERTASTKTSFQQVPGHVSQSAKDDCQPLLHVDGSKDCDHGMRLINGKRELCAPSKASCSG